MIHRLLAWFGTWLLSLRIPLTERGLYLVFRYGTEAQADVYLKEALAVRQSRERVVFIPVMTNAQGVPTGLEGKGSGNGPNDLPN